MSKRKSKIHASRISGLQSISLTVTVSLFAFSGKSRIRINWNGDATRRALGVAAAWGRIVLPVWSPFPISSDVSGLSARISTLFDLLFGFFVAAISSFVVKFASVVRSAFTSGFELFVLRGELLRPSGGETLRDSEDKKADRCKRMRAASGRSSSVLTRFDARSAMAEGQKDTW